MKFILLTTHPMQGGLKMNENKYTLRYKFEDTETVYSFPVECDMSELVHHFKLFLLACSWLPSQVDTMFNEEFKDD